MGGKDGLTLAEYRRLLHKHGSLAAVAKALGRNERSLRRWAARHVPEYGTSRKEAAGQGQQGAAATEAAGPELLLPHLARPRTVAELCDLVDRSPKSVRAWLQALQDRGFNLRQQGGAWQIDKDVMPAETHVSHATGEARRKVGIVADTHLGSKCQQLRHLNDFYDRCQDQGVTDVYNAGDLIAGVGVYKGQHAEIFLHTEDEQIDYAVEYYPRRPGMRTHVIGGNHDLVFVKQGGADPLKVIADRRDDINYLGPYSAWIELAPGYTMYLLHPDGRPAYALCHDDMTEVLTSSGWKFFAELTTSDKVATLSPSGQLEYQEPTDYIAMRYTGYLYHFGGGRTSSYDVRVTPHHRMWVCRPWNHSKFQFIDAAAIRKGRSWALRRGCQWKGNRIESVVVPGLPSALPIDSFLTFLGWFIAEGSLNPNNNQIQIAQFPGRAQDEIIDCVRSLGFKPKVYGGKKIVFSCKPLAEYLRGLGKCHEKYVFPWIKELSPELIRIFLLAFWKGDGCFYRDGRMRHVCTTSKRLADDLQELALKAGFTACVHHSYPPRRKHRICGVTVHNQRDRYVVSIAYDRDIVEITKAPRVEPYDGLVYCVTVPNGIVLTRRNGKCAWSGNSYKLQKIVESFEGGKKPNVLVAGHWHSWCECSPRNVHAMLAMCFESQTDHERRNALQPVVGGLILDISFQEEGQVHELDYRRVVYLVPKEHDY